MEFVEFSHNLWLIVASFAVALMAGFTGLSLTNGLSTYSYTRRKIAISFAAIALGGGIWSMHFVAMLGLQLPFVLLPSGNIHGLPGLHLCHTFCGSV